MGAATFTKLVERFGTPAHVLREADRRSLARLRRMPSGLAEQIALARERLEEAGRQIESLLAEGVRVITIEQRGYPRLLRRIKVPPPLLYCRGEFSIDDETAVAIIGSTHPSPQGAELAYGFARRLAKAGHTVVSGYAHGIDSAAHLGALEAGGRGLYVLPTGIRRFESRWRFPAPEVLAAHGAILSESHPDQDWTTPAALARNRITAGLSRAVLLIEGREQGGTMATFGIARREGIPCFVVQYENPSPEASGNAVAIAKGGIPVTSFSDVGRIRDVLLSKP